MPFTIFLVDIVSGGQKQTRRFAFDAAFGLLDPYELSGKCDTLRVGDRNAVPAALDDTAAAPLLADRLRRLLYSQGFFRLRDFKINVNACGETVHIPYCVGFYGFGEQAKLRVLDAVRCRPEGAKLRQALARWLSA